MTAYKGEKAWAPCAHNEEEEKALEPWIDSIVGFKNEEPQRLSKPSILEDLLWTLGLGWYEGEWKSDVKDIRFGFYADQWVGVHCEILYDDGHSDDLWTEGDSFTLAMVKTLERLKEKIWRTPEQIKQQNEEQE